MTGTKPRGVPEGEYTFDLPPEAPPVARAVCITAAILETTHCRDLEELENRLHEPQIRDILTRAHINTEYQELILANRGVLSLVQNTKPKTRLVICPQCDAVYLSGAGGVPKTCQTGPAGCDGTPYACTPANRIPHTSNM